MEQSLPGRSATVTRRVLPSARARGFNGAMRTLVVFLAVGSVLSAQGGKREPFPRTDPYTKSAREKIEPAGYVSFGPFRFGDDHTTAQVETALEGVPLIWVETAHFKLGSGLPEYRLGDDKPERERVRAELEILATRLPDVKVKAKELDPWMRLHLLALRLETLYADFQRQFGLREGEFPALGEDPGDGARGRGPWLGMGAKYTVIVFERRADLARYGVAFFGERPEAPLRRHLPESDSWLYATAAEFLPEGSPDAALACDLAAHVAQNLALGLRGPRGDVPFAVLEGLGQWFARRSDVRFPVFSGSDPARLKGPTDWPSEVRSRVEHQAFPPTAELLAMEAPDAFEWAHHLMLWSRFDFLLTREDGAAGNFLRALKAPLDPAAPPLDPETRSARARAALESATGGELEAFDRAWSEWVLKSYGR